MKNKKLLKILMPMATIVSTSAIVLPLASCAQTTTEGVKVSISSSSSEGVEIKETKAELNKDSTVTLTIPSMQAIKEVRVSVGSTNLTIDRDFSVDVNTKVINISASSMTSKDVAVTVFTTKMDGIKASVIGSKKFEALETIKASDIKVEATYESSPIGTVNPLVYGTDYIVYDAGSKEEITNFDTVGYTVTRDDGRFGSKSFDFEYVPFTRYVYEGLDVDTTERYEPEEIESVDVCTAKFAGDTIYPSDLIVKAKMTQPETNEDEEKVLEWGTGYTVWVNDKEITDFGENGYTFTNQGSQNLVIKSVENPEEALQTITFAVQPVELKSALCMTNAGESANVAVTSISDKTTEFKWSKDGKNWNDVQQAVVIPLAKNESIQFKALTDTTSAPSQPNKIHIVSTDSTAGKEAKVSLSGSVLGLINNNIPSQTPTTLATIQFALLFQNSTAITSISKDFLGDIGLSQQCYYGMFSGCSALTQAPDIPDRDLAGGTCQEMFKDCISLKAAPNLTSKELAIGCYNSMFSGCSALETCPDFVNKTMYSSSCFEMFLNCTSLKKAPNLPAKTLGTSCYKEMFMGCTSLESASDLPATTLPVQCYCQMFSGCTSLVNAPAIYATELVGTGTDGSSCAKMFEYCSSLKTAPDLYPTQLNYGCYNSMFSRCTSLETAPKISATTMGVYCCQAMFLFCTSLKQAPELAAETLAEGCYNAMFQKCTSLVTAPALPATTMATSCYLNMFAQCDSLINAPKLSATTLADLCYKQMFARCSSLEIAIDEGDENHKVLKGLDTTGLTDVYTNMFSGTKNWVEGAQVETDKTYYWVEQE